jgi:hypothetical protein
MISPYLMRNRLEMLRLLSMGYDILLFDDLGILGDDPSD